MKLHFKTTLIIIGTLIIGFVLGFASSIFFVQSRFSKAREFHRKGKMIEFFIDKIDLKDEQREKAEPIIEKYNVRFKTHSQTMRNGVEEIFDSLKMELEPILTEEQKEKLKTRFRRIDRFMRKGPPPPPGDFD